MTKRKEIDISILRIIVCLSVFGIHLGQQANFQGIIRRITDFGEKGAYLFFIISGLVCFYSFEKNSFELSGKNYCIYILKRVFRILPLYYIILLLNFVLHGFIFCDVPVDSTGLYWGKYILLLSRIVPSDNNFWNNLSATWPISSFMMFYFLAPFMWKWIKSLKSVVAFWGIFFIVDIVLQSFSNMLEPFRMLHYFACGIGVYYVLKEKRQREAIIILSIVLMVQGILTVEFSVFTYSIIFVVLMIVLKGTVITSEKVLKLIDILDSYTFTVYLCHAVVMEMIEKITFDKTNAIFWRLEVIFIAVFGTIIFSVIMKYVVEKPMNKVCTRMVKKINGE